MARPDFRDKYSSSNKEWSKNPPNAHVSAVEDELALGGSITEKEAAEICGVNWWTVRRALVKAGRNDLLQLILVATHGSVPYQNHSNYRKGR